MYQFPFEDKIYMFFFRLDIKQRYEEVFRNDNVSKLYRNREFQENNVVVKVSCRFFLFFLINLINLSYKNFFTAIG